MTALQTTISANIVPLRTNSQALVQASPSATTLTRLLHWSESWRDEPGVHLPDLPPDLVDALPVAIEQAMLELAPSDPGEVMAALSTLASRRGFPLPNGLALEMDVEALANLPRDLWRKAFRAVWEGFTYRRMPEVPDFRAHIVDDLAERRARLDRLQEMRLRLETIRLREQWDAESRQRRPCA